MFFCSICSFWSIEGLEHFQGVVVFFDNVQNQTRQIGKQPKRLQKLREIQLIFCQHKVAVRLQRDRHDRVTREVVPDKHGMSVANQRGDV